MILVKKSPIEDQNNDDMLQSSSIQLSYNHEGSNSVHKVTPVPRSFSDIFAAPKMVLVKKSNVQNKQSNPTSMETIQIAAIPSTTSTPKTTTTMQSTTSTTMQPTTSTTLSTTTTTMITTTIATTSTNRYIKN